MDSGCFEALQMFAGLTWEKHHYFIVFFFVLIWKISVALHSICLFFFFSHMIMYTYNRWIIPPKSHKEKNSSYVCLSGQWIIEDRYNGNNYILLETLPKAQLRRLVSKLLSCAVGSKVASARLGNSQENFRFVLLQGNILSKCLLCVDKLFILNQAIIMNSLNRHWFLCF